MEMLRKREVDRQLVLGSIRLLEGYRLATAQDVKPGKELFMSKVDASGRAESPCPIKIVKVEGFDKLLVQYKKDEVLHALPLDYIINVKVEEVEGSPYCTTLYLVKK